MSERGSQVDRRSFLRTGLGATAGAVVFEGQDLTELSDKDLRPLRQKIQVIFQDPYGSLNPRMPISDIIGEGLVAMADKENGWGKRSVRDERVGDYLDGAAALAELVRVVSPSGMIGGSTLIRRNSSWISRSASTPAAGGRRSALPTRGSRWPPSMAGKRWRPAAWSKKAACRWRSTPARRPN